MTSGRAVTGSSRQGITLLEILLVLGLLALAAGLSLPAIMGFVRDKALRSGADAVRSALQSTRLRAMERGEAYSWRFEPGGRWFAAVPRDAAGGLVRQPAQAARKPAGGPRARGRGTIRIRASTGPARSAPAGAPVAAPGAGHAGIHPLVLRTSRGNLPGGVCHRGCLRAGPLAAGGGSGFVRPPRGLPAPLPARPRPPRWGRLGAGGATAGRVVVPIPRGISHDLPDRSAAGPRCRRRAPRA